MRKEIFAVICVLVLSFIFNSCAAKLTTIRPTLINRITVENIAAGEKTELFRGDNDETDWLMDDFVYQMEQFYKSVGLCDEEDEHLYSVRYYMGEQLELDVFINTDSSVCKNGRRYVQKADDSTFDRSVDLDQWEDCFAPKEVQ